MIDNCFMTKILFKKRLNKIDVYNFECKMKKKDKY